MGMNATIREKIPKQEGRLYLRVSIVNNFLSAIGYIKLWIESKLLEVRVFVIYLGTVGVFGRRDALYCDLTARIPVDQR